uniref:Uncharacterized protein n=1 Tax=Cercocebus atys TaxID=9531 RepID=A0A2K5NQR3_CERAT
MNAHPSDVLKHPLHPFTIISLVLFFKMNLKVNPSHSFPTVCRIQVLKPSVSFPMLFVKPQL